MKTQKIPSKTSKQVVAKTAQTKKTAVKKTKAMPTNTPKSVITNNFIGSYGWPFPLI